MQKNNFREEYAPDVLDLLPLISQEMPFKLSRLEKWIHIKYDLYTQYTTKKLGTEAQKEFEQIETVFKLISKIVADNEQAVSFKDVLIQKNEKIIIVRTNDAPKGIALSLLSQGYQNLFYWVGGIISRAYQINEYCQKEKPAKYKENIFDMNAIVLIDEIDTYLHPKWQRNILKVLVEEFPNIQFVVNTHSPLVVNGISNDLTNVYWINPNRKPINLRLYGNSVKTILLKAFALPNLREDKIQKEIDQLFVYLETKELEKAEELLNSLKKRVIDDPDILQAETTLFAIKD